MIKKFSQYGMTLVELTVVLLILIALAGLVVPYIGGSGDTAMCRATDATLQAVKEAIMGGASGPGFYGDNLGAFPAEAKGGNRYALHFLFSAKDVGASVDSWPAFNPKTAVGWRGPYLTTGASLDTTSLGALNAGFGKVFDPVQPSTAAYVHIDLKLYDGADADTTATVGEAAELIHVLDAWHRPIVLQVPYNIHTNKPNFDYARLVSAGWGQGLDPGDAAIDTKIQYDSTDTNHPLPDASDRGDDRVLFLKNPDPLAGGNVPCDRI